MSNNYFLLSNLINKVWKMSKNPNKWDGIIQAILKDKSGDFGGLFDVLFSYLDRKSKFFEDYEKNDLLLRLKAEEYFAKHHKGKKEFEVAKE